jgi:hypothetical protein
VGDAGGRLDAVGVDLRLQLGHAPTVLRARCSMPVR